MNEVHWYLRRVDQNADDENDGDGEGDNADDDVVFN